MATPDTGKLYVIATYDAPADLIAVAPCVTSIVCTCADHAVLDISSLALGLDDGMVIGLGELNDAVNAQAESGTELLRDLAERLGCPLTMTVVTAVADLAVAHAVQQRQHDLDARAKDRPSPTTVAVPPGPDRTSMEWMLAQMEEAEGRRRQVLIAS